MLCLTFDDKETRPTDFTVPRGSKRILHVLKRESPPGVAPAGPRHRPADVADRLDDLTRKMADMQAEIARLRDELRKSQGKKP